MTRMRWSDATRIVYADALFRALMSASRGFSMWDPKRSDALLAAAYAREHVIRERCGCSSY